MCLLANESAFINFSMIFLPLRSVEGHSLVSFSISVCFFKPASYSRSIWSAVGVICGFDGFGCDKYGKRDNKFKDINNFPTPYKLDFGNKLVHFSCVGSGMNFYNDKLAAINVSRSYVECALDRYALFCKTFYKEDLPGFNLDKYKEIFSIENWY
jgi:hypothetical protein